ncbi:universal stress protein [Undibacterium terreum]|uniref:Universal stress protein n=1 Tax=Undibacterium terreum TaxID=1224302 RepID=A0A916XQT0_9BURK|nr:universal stress protein [Undibacterium terreum]GGC98996.1 universal stress protein [Undibacterium terreum]
MYKRILIPTDGSDLSDSSVQAGIEFAKQLNADVVGVFVAANFQYPIYVDLIPPNTPTEPEYQNAMRVLGETYLHTIQDAASRNGVEFQSVVQFNDSPAKEIVHTAHVFGCDLIFMGSHGRSGLGQFLLGSVTTKVLSNCQIPVLVHRVKHETTKTAKAA